MGVQLKGDFNALRKALQNGARIDLRHLTKPVGAALVASTRERFRDGRDPTGRRWDKLSDETLAGAFTKRDRTPLGRIKTSALRREANRKILVQRGNLKNSINFKAGRTTVAVGSNLKYARIHQLGGKAGRGRKVTIPARPYLGISEGDAQEIARLIERLLREVI